MTEFKRKYITIDRDRHGNVRHYFRYRDRKVRIYETPGTTDYELRYSSLVSATLKAPETSLLPNEVDAHNLSGFVYFLATETAVKIGYSADPNQRLKALKIALSGNINFIAMVRGSMLNEKTLHSMLSQYRLRGEWFELNATVRTVIGATITTGSVQPKTISAAIQTTIEKSHQPNPGETNARKR